MENSKTILIIVLVLAAYFYMSSDNVAAQPANAPAPVSAPACYAQASSIVSPDWAGMNRLQRAYVAMAVISDCEAVR